MERLLKIMEVVCQRPGLYVPNCDMRGVRAYLDGFVHAMSGDELDSYPFGGFLRWLEVIKCE